MNQKVIHKLIRADLKAAGFDFDKYLGDPPVIKYGCFDCPFCSREFATDKALDSHLVQEFSLFNLHTRTKVLYMCPICDMRYWSPENLASHMRIIHPEYFERKSL